MADTTPQTADGKVLFHFAMSLDGFVAGPDHEMGWMTGVSVRPGLPEEYIATTGAVLGGRKGWDQAIDGSRPYGGAWQGPIFVLTHHPEDAKKELLHPERHWPYGPSRTMWRLLPAAGHAVDHVWEADAVLAAGRAGVEVGRQAQFPAAHPAHPYPRLGTP